MGLLLKEVLKTVCGPNQWSYAVFWKMGSHNSKLLIWEECYYEHLPFPPHPGVSGSPNLPYQNREGCWQERERVCSLISKMAENDSVKFAGEGIIGRAAFTGDHQWILRNAHPQEVYDEVHHQFSAGMQTIAVIPVLPHGVVQLGSFLTISENIGFVNDVKSLILQWGCVPDALQSADCSAKLSVDRLGAPATATVSVSTDPPSIPSNCILSVANGFNQKSNSHTSRPIVQTHFPIRGDVNNRQGSVSTPQTHNLSQMWDGLCQLNAMPMTKSSFAGLSENRFLQAAEVIPSNLGSFQQKYSVSYNAKSEFRDLSGFGESALSGSTLKCMEQQIMSVIGCQDHANPSVNASSSANTSQLITDGGCILDHSQNSSSTSLLAGIPVQGGLGNLLRENLFADSGLKTPKESPIDLFGAKKAGNGLQIDDSIKAGGSYSLANLSRLSGAFSMPLEGHGISTSTDQQIEDNLIKACNIPSIHCEGDVPMDGEIPSFGIDKHVTCQSLMKSARHEQVCGHPSSGDDLLDVLGVDLENHLLNGDWNKLLADESDANAENTDRNATCAYVPAINPGCYSANEAIQDTDHLLDAVVSRAKSVVKQNSDDMSCRTTLTSSTSSVHSQVMSDDFKGRLFDFPKNGGKTGAMETSSIISGCNKIDVGKCSQRTSIYGSQLSSWVANSSNVNRENSISTGYSKRSHEGCKPNRKRLKPGENPRPRPKDRQMIQDRMKELREIVPNGAKCTMDALLERTIKHMLFLQSVTKHADKLKQTGDSKIISKESGLLLKENFEGGATWAYEVGSQSMVCPIIVENLNHPRQMLVEMLCEERGLFLEIADLIRGLGLTILKGVMEAQNDKLWARFAVEANRDVTRMEIFMSLIRLLEQTGKGSTSSPNAVSNNMTAYHSFPQATQIPATGMPSSLQ